MQRSPDVQHTRPVWAEISAEKLQVNYRLLCEAAGADTPVLAVVKANAYGHGAVQCAPMLAAAGARWLGVTSVEEGVAVRRSLGILPETMSPRILVMCGIWPGEEAACLDRQLTPVVWEPYHLDLLEREARRRGLPEHSLAVHVEIDTGMARQGVSPGPLLTRLMDRFHGSPLRLEGVLTHFASAECVADSQNEEQRERFEGAMNRVCADGGRPALIHIGNTSGVDSGFAADWLPELARRCGAQPMTRAGLALYGYALPLQGDGKGSASRLPELLPVLTWKTRIASLREVEAGATVGYNATFTAIRPMRLALLPVGYADGFRRALSSTETRRGGAVLIGGRRAPVVGRVSMDLTVVDVSGIQEAGIGEEAVLLGGDGQERISAAEHAAWAGTSTYEVLCGISDRVPREVVP